jgi:hypothetical protein
MVDTVRTILFGTASVVASVVASSSSVTVIAWPFAATTLASPAG